ncbi:MAG: sulfite exporter TauE/SafE family protein [Gammaproteobacteria bacterium]|nr:sulfite exporter TauE/SafE family protein [Gammaproteobacteria bacterium]
MTEFDVGLVIAAWLTGLAGGSGHCIGMCGGIVGALGLGQGSGWRGVARLAAAHLGRVSSYALAGAIVGLAGASVVTGVFGANGILALRVMAAALIFAIGLQLLLGRPLLTRLEQAGSRFWRLLAPQMRKLLPPGDALRAYGVGALWGWLPCGLVYAELAVAAASGGPVSGALVMSFFGLGTIVSLSAMSVLLHSLGIARMPRQASGALLILFAIWTVLPLI